jgi:hypothetical protein
MAEASTMLRTMKRLMALSLGTMAAEDSQRTRLTWPAGGGGSAEVSTRRRHHGRCAQGRAPRRDPRSVSCSPRPCLLRPPFLRFFCRQEMGCEPTPKSAAARQAEGCNVLEGWATCRPATAGLRAACTNSDQLKPRKSLADALWAMLIMLHGRRSYPAPALQLSRTWTPYCHQKRASKLRADCCPAC